MQLSDVADLIKWRQWKELIVSSLTGFNDVFIRKLNYN